MGEGKDASRYEDVEGHRYQRRYDAVFLDDEKGGGKKRRARQKRGSERHHAELFLRDFPLGLRAEDIEDGDAEEHRSPRDHEVAHRYSEEAEDERTEKDEAHRQAQGGEERFRQHAPFLVALHGFRKRDIDGERADGVHRDEYRDERQEQIFKKIFHDGLVPARVDYVNG